MLKLEKVINDKNISIYTLFDGTGDHSRVKSLKKVLDRESDITSLSQTILTSIARGMGVRMEDILEDFDLDGTSGQIDTIKRLVERLKKRLGNIKNAEIRDNHMVLQSNNDQVRFDKIPSNKKQLDLKSTGKGYILAINVDQLEFGNGIIDNPFPFEKNVYEFINPNLSHSEQDLPDTTQLNAEYLEKSQLRGKWNKNKQPLSIHAFANRHISKCPAMIQYTSLPSGGDLKAIISVIDKNGETELTEVYGCEWIDEDEHKDIVYYKSQYFEPFNKDNIRDSEKEIISEIEFFKGIRSQFNKFKISR